MSGGTNKATAKKPRARKRGKGIFCLEGDWWNDLNQSGSVKPMLDLISAGADIAVPSVHRDVATRDELEFYLRKWVQGRYKTYPLLCLAFHGSEGALHLSDGRKAESTVTLDELAELLDGKCHGRIIHFDGCSTVVGDVRHLKRFLRQTGALAVTGFTNDVPWLDAAAFDILLFATFQQQALTRGGMKAVKRRVFTELRGMARELGFRMEIRPE
ncbi:MAG: hypothetical protein K1X94_01840 [Sandaracinaceae bacterium]|nr:hypothetical protein [Sandaracinaceae bacterium]